MSTSSPNSPATATPSDGRDSRWAAHRVARRKELVDAALRAIRRHGAGVGMDEIAAEAGTSKTVIYRHLGDRLGLYLAVCESVDALILTEIDQASRSGERITPAHTAPVPQMLRAVIDSYLKLVERDPEVYRFVVRRPQVALSDELDAHDPVTGLSGRIADNVAELLVALQPQDGDAPRRARAISWALVGLVKESADRWLEDPTGLGRAELAHDLARFAHAGLAATFERVPADA